MRPIAALFHPLVLAAAAAPSLAVALTLALALTGTTSCAPAPDAGEGEGEGDASEGEGDASEGEGDAAEGEGEGEGDTPPACPSAIDDAIRTCVTDLQADPEASQGLFLVDLLLQCSDAEALGDDHDAYCADNPVDPACLVSYEIFATDVVPECRERIRAELFNDNCVFPGTFGDFPTARTLAEVARADLDPSALDATDEQQVVLAVQASSHTDVTTAAEAFAAVDEGIITRVQYEDVSARRAYDALLYGAGDSLYGRVFFHGSPFTVALIHDGDISGCAAEPGPEARVCSTFDDCAPDSLCIGADDAATGLCIFSAPLENQGDPCDVVTAPCAPASGLVCVPTDALATAGTCAPAWSRATFASGFISLPIGDPIVDTTLDVTGLASSIEFATLSLLLEHDAADHVRVLVTPPNGAPALAYDGTVDPVTPGEVYLQDVPLALDAAATAVGAWTLEVQSEQGTGTLLEWSLTIANDFDAL
jgi:hypothetical protein